MISVENLSKSFKKIVKEQGVKGSLKALVSPKTEIVEAVKNVSFQVPRGEILGFIGPNGAGKSTTIKMLTGILTPTSGICEIDGKIPYKSRKKYAKEIGVVFGQRTQLWWDLPLNETYTVLKVIYEVPDDAFNKRMALLNDILDLNEFVTSPVRTLSLGQRMRADIAASLLHSPKVLFLDEPTIGLDVVVKDNIRRAIAQLSKEEGTTVILTTHDLNDIESLCKRIVMIDKGRKVYDGEISMMKHKYGQIRELHFEVLEKRETKKLSYHEYFKVSGSDVVLEQDEVTVKVHFNSALIPVQKILQYTLDQIRIKDISVKDGDIEDIIRRVYSHEVNIDK